MNFSGIWCCKLWVLHPEQSNRMSVNTPFTSYAYQGQLKPSKPGDSSPCYSGHDPLDESKLTDLWIDHLRTLFFLLFNHLLYSVVEAGSSYVNTLYFRTSLPQWKVLYRICGSSRMHEIIPVIDFGLRFLILWYVACRSYICSTEKFIQKAQPPQKSQTGPTKMRSRMASSMTGGATMEIGCSQTKTSWYFLREPFRRRVYDVTRASLTLPSSHFVAMIQMGTGSTGSKQMQIVSTKTMIHHKTSYRMLHDRVIL